PFCACGPGTGEGYAAGGGYLGDASTVAAGPQPAQTVIRRGARPEPAWLTHAVQVLQRELVQPLEGHAARGQRLDVRGAAGHAPPGLLGSTSGPGQLAAPRRGQRRLDLGVGAERADLVPQDQVVAHARGGGVPHPVVVLGARRLVVEVHGPVVPAGL